MKMLYNGRIELYYLVNTYKPLSSLLPRLDPDHFITIVGNLLAGIIDVKNNGFLACHNIDSSFEHIYVDSNTFKVGLVYLPLNKHEYIVAIYDGIQNVKNVYKEIKISAQKGKVSFGTRLKQYLFNSKSYMTDDKGKALKWRDVIQKRGKIRTLRTDNIMYRVTKARTIDQYNKTLTNAQKIAGKITKYAKHGSNIVKYSQKFFDYTLGGDVSGKKIGKDVHKGVSKKFKLPDTISKLYDLKDKNWKSFTSDYNGFRGLEGLAG